MERASTSGIQTTHTCKTCKTRIGNFREAYNSELALKAEDPTSFRASEESNTCHSQSRVYKASQETGLNNLIHQSTKHYNNN